MAISAACMVTAAAFWAVYEQQGNTMQLWPTRTPTGRRSGFTIPSTWYQALTPS
ncbi:MAG: hypothetical protein IPF94_09605 [Betaproteobacteria bacterium]|nr:hypothetical protein [Betaproteobacteria bacterium]